MKSTRLLISAMMAVALLLIVLVGITLAKAPDADNAAVASNAVLALDGVVTTTVTPEYITQLGDHEFEYSVIVHNQSVTPTTTVLTLTLDSNLEFDKDVVGTLVPPGSTVLLPGNKVVWTVELTPCHPEELIVYAKGTVDTLEMPYKAYTTTVEWDGGSRDLVTRLLLYNIYMPFVSKNLGS